MAAGLCAAALAASGPALAHPHIFIDTGLHLIFDDTGQLAAVRVVWAYDEFTSLLVLEDRGLDSDYDGKLTEDELARLDGFDMGWDEGWPGDLYLKVGEREVALSRPVEHTASFESGRIVTTHLRALETRVEVGGPPVVFAAYDPSYYVAYTLALPTRFEGREGCEAAIAQPNLSAANQRLLDAMAELTADQSLEEYDFPPVGEEFAEKLTVTCAPRS
jgi:ABC-type uncharacterized transport system substrate-binding protein